MATINTIHDLFQLLRDNPEWADELRALILTTELIDLPRKFDEFAAETFYKFVKETRAHNAASDAAFKEFVEETRACGAATDATFNEFVKETFYKFVNETFAEFVEEVRVRSAATETAFAEFVEETRVRGATTDATIKTIQDDIGELKGSNAIAAALRNPEMIVFAISEDLRREAVLTSQDLIDMLRSKPDVVPDEARMSFLEADLVVRAKDGSGEDHYITAEVSNTVGSNDVDRTIRNAGFLRELTGKQSHAVVVGNDINGTAAMIIEREGIPWYQLRRRDTRPR